MVIFAWSLTEAFRRCAVNEVSIFAAAVEKADPAERAAYLDDVCRHDAALRGRVDSLLAAHDHAGQFLERPAVDATHAHPGQSGETRTYDCEQSELEAEARSILEPSAKPDALGRIGPYEVLEVLGRGGFGIVYRAFDETLQRVVAVKVLLPRMATTSPARKRFLREARSSAAVRHENVVQVHAVVEQPTPYLVMEFIPGETLQQRIDRTGPLELKDVLSIGRQIAEGLAAAHATGLVHRDIKPANVLIENGPQARVKLTDFGLARAADDASMSQSGVVAGTPMYMAPEQARGDTLDHRADLFSLGSVLYVMATGRPPFRASSTLAVLKRVADEQPRPIREIIPEVPDWFCRIVEKLHEKDPERRFQSAREVADVLTDCERQLAVHDQLTDLSQIPLVKASVVPWTNRRVRTFGGIIGGLALAYIALWFYPFTARYLTNRSSLEIVPTDGIHSVTIRRAEAIDDPYISKFDLSQPHTISLEPGKYKFTPLLAPGWKIDYWIVTITGLRSARIVWPGDVPLSITIGRGKYATLVPVLQPVPPAPSPQNNQVPAEGWVPLFNGHDLTGWTPHPDNKANWVVDNEILTAQGGDGYLATVRNDFRDFHLRAEVKINNNGDSGIIFRSEPGRNLSVVNHRHYEGDLLGGSYYHFYTRDGGKDLDKWTAKERLLTQIWTVYEIVATGGQITVLVDGRTIFEITEPNPNLTPGPIILQSATPETVVQFRKLEIRELPATNVTPGNPAILKPLRDLITAKEKSRDLVKVRKESGAASEMELLLAEIDVLESLIRLAQAERNSMRTIELLTTLVNQRLEEKRLTSQLIEAGILRVGDMNSVETRVAESRVRLAEAKAAATKP
jgi:serine/threonine protein kinase